MTPNRRASYVFDDNKAGGVEFEANAFRLYKSSHKYSCRESPRGGNVWLISVMFLALFFVGLEEGQEKEARSRAINKLLWKIASLSITCWLYHSVFGADKFSSRSMWCETEKERKKVFFTIRATRQSSRRFIALNQARSSRRCPNMSRKKKSSKAKLARGRSLHIPPCMINTIKRRSLFSGYENNFLRLAVISRRDD